jgi:hypothetical protein
MEQLQTCVDRLVSAGIQSYIGLLCLGEQRRSKALLHDVLQLSGLAHGGPSAKVGGGAYGVSYMLMYFTIRGVLASLLVLRATVYWSKIPDLEQLQRCSRRVADVLENEAGLGPGMLGRGSAAELSSGLSREDTDHHVTGPLTAPCDCGSTGCSGASGCARHAPHQDGCVAL